MAELVIRILRDIAELLIIEPYSYVVAVFLLASIIALIKKMM